MLAPSMPDAFTTSDGGTSDAPATSTLLTVRYGEWYAHQPAEPMTSASAPKNAMRACSRVMRHAGSGGVRRCTPRSGSFVLTTRVARPGFAALYGQRFGVRALGTARLLLPEASEREIDPVSLHTQDEHAYLLAWCHRAQGRRAFRVDRILDATETSTPVEAHDVDPDVDFTPSGDAPLATIVLASQARTVAEQVPVESVRDLPDGAFEVRLRVTNPVWLRQLLLARARHVRSVEPADVADDVRQTARTTLAAYARLADDA